MRARWGILILGLAACAGPERASTTTAPKAARALPVTAPAPAAPSAAAPKACALASAATVAVLTSLDDATLRAEDRETGALTSFHAQLFRVFRRLHEHGHVQSIVATHARSAHGPVYALTLIPNGADTASLAFATAPCDGGEPDLLGESVPLAGADARITYASRVRLGSASPVTALQIDVADGPFEHGYRLPPKIAHANVLVGEPHGALAVTAPKGAGYGVLAMLAPLEREGPKDRDVPLLGSGWYPQGDAAVYLHVHQNVPRPEDACKPTAPPSGPPSLRLLARVDAQRGLVTSDLGTAFVVGFATSPPQAVTADPAHVLRGGPGAGRGFARAKVDWLWGTYPTLEEARVAARAAPNAKVFASEPPAGTPPPAPFVLPVEAGGASHLDCYY